MWLKINSVAFPQLLLARQQHREHCEESSERPLFPAGLQQSQSIDSFLLSSVSKEALIK